MKNELSFTLDRFKILSGSALKLLAVVLMLIDHSALILRRTLPVFSVTLVSVGDFKLTLYSAMRLLGRLAFPIFCFLITEGFLHTRSRKKYALSLLAFAVISEIPFNLMIGGSVFYLRKQNIYFTLLFGLLLITIYEKAKNRLASAVLMLAVIAAARIMRVDYGMFGSMLILLLYLLRDRPDVQAVFAYPLLSGGFAALAAFVPINMYNGKRGFIRSRPLKYAFYVFYPLHISILLLVRYFLRLNG